MKAVACGFCTRFPTDYTPAYVGRGSVGTLSASLTWILPGEGNESYTTQYVPLSLAVDRSDIASRVVDALLVRDLFKTAEEIVSSVEALRAQLPWPVAAAKLGNNATERVGSSEVAAAEAGW